MLWLITLKKRREERKNHNKSNYMETEQQWPPSVPFKANHGQLMVTTWHWQLTWCKCTVQSLETDDSVRKKVQNPVNDSVDQPAAFKKFQRTVHTCGKTMEAGWTTGNSAKEWGFWPTNGIVRKTIQLFRTAKRGRLHTYRKYSTKCQTVAKTEHKQLATLWHNEHVHYHKNLPLL